MANAKFVVSGDLPSTSSGSGTFRILAVCSLGLLERLPT